MNTTSRIVLLTTPLLLLASAPIAFARTTVNVSSEGTSESHVSVNSTEDSSNTTRTTTSNGQTDIVIECNGVKKEYHSTEGGNVSVHCDDGEAKIETNITSAPTNDQTATVTPNLEKEKEDIEKKKDEIKEEVKGAMDKAKEERKNMFENLRTFFKDFFKNLF